LPALIRSLPVASHSERVHRVVTLVRSHADDPRLPVLLNALTGKSDYYALLALMLLVGGFSMITGLVILVLDKSRQIGILKALGSKDSTLRLSLLLLSGRIIVKGLFWGNLLALSLCLLQQHYRIIRLNPANYFTDAVPIQLDLLLWLGINLGTLLLILAMILIPTRLVGRIRPAESMRID